MRITKLFLMAIALAFLLSSCKNEDMEEEKLENLNFDPDKIANITFDEFYYEQYKNELGMTSLYNDLSEEEKQSVSLKLLSLFSRDKQNLVLVRQKKLIAESANELVFGGNTFSEKTTGIFRGVRADFYTPPHPLIEWPFSFWVLLILNDNGSFSIMDNSDGDVISIQPSTFKFNTAGIYTLSKKDDKTFATFENKKGEHIINGKMQIINLMGGIVLFNERQS